MLNQSNKTPLADQMRPAALEEFLGQDEIVGQGKMLRQAIAAGQPPSMIFWGPPGSGKTTLAHIIARFTQADFIQMSAVTSGLKDLRLVIKKAKENAIEDKRTILFIDEIHRWNKAQQDALLPHVEKGVITLIGATTENPSFEVRGALLSRSRVFVLKQLKAEQIIEIIKRALRDKDRGLGKLEIKINDETINLLAQMSNGDARVALNVLEYTAFAPFNTRPTGRHQSFGRARPTGRHPARMTLSGWQSFGREGGEEDLREITADVIKQAFQKSHLLYDKDGEEHYNIISALHKSLRGSDADAALYWLARMLEAGEDPLYIARRLTRFASEDIGLANSRALEQAVAAYQACHFIGLPECNVILAQAAVYLAKCEKSNELYVAYNQAARDVHEHGNLPAPLSIRNAPTKLMKDLGYGKDYKYSPDYGYKEKQDYLPEKLKGRKYLK